MTVNSEYEQVNPLANKQPFEQYLSALLTRIFWRDETFTAYDNQYIVSFSRLIDQIKKFNEKFIKDKSALRLAKVLVDPENREIRAF